MPLGLAGPEVVFLYKSTSKGFYFVTEIFVLFFFYACYDFGVDNCGN
jgi:hypothetical protein